MPFIGAWTSSTTHSAKLSSKSASSTPAGSLDVDWVLSYMMSPPSSLRHGRTTRARFLERRAYGRVAGRAGIAGGRGRKTLLSTLFLFSPGTPLTSTLT